MQALTLSLNRKHSDGHFVRFVSSPAFHRLNLAVEAMIANRHGLSAKLTGFSSIKMFFCDILCR
jgi:hypothetical protein